MINFGVIGSSKGNGHPFSWSAIFNGYNYEAMLDCGYPAIPEYLSKQSYPSDFLCNLGKVTHVFSQDILLSEKVQKASLIENIVNKPEELIGQVGAMLLARDDAENHLSMAKTFIEAGMPIFIDKPFALSTEDAQTMLAMQIYDHQIFSCSSLRYATELLLTDAEKDLLGSISYIEAITPKYWNTYAVHLLEPIIVNSPNRGALRMVNTIEKNNITIASIEWENVLAKVTCTGTLPSPIEIIFYGNRERLVKKFSDSFSCFKMSLNKFVDQIRAQENIIPRLETLEIVKILELGNNA